MEEPSQLSPSTERIVDAALRCVARSGFDRASMKDIAREAGVSKSLLHYHFQSKENLLLEVQARNFRNLAVGIEKLARSEGASLEQGLLGLDKLWELLVAFRDHVPLSLEMWSEGTRRPDLRVRLDVFASEMIALTERGLRAALGDSIKRLPWPPQRLARLVFAILCGMSLHAYFAPSPETAGETYRDLRLLIERALHEPRMRMEAT